VYLNCVLLGGKRQSAAKICGVGLWSRCGGTHRKLEHPTGGRGDDLTTLREELWKERVQ